MEKVPDELSLEQKILKKLEAMKDVYLIENNRKKSEKLLFKNGVNFGKISKKSVYLKSQHEEFVRVTKSVLNNSDEFLKSATRSYWLANRMI